MNEEHLAVLTRGPAAWNAWRNDNGYAFLEISHASLDGANLAGYDFSGIRFTFLGAIGADLRRCAFSSTYFDYGNFGNADLSGSAFLNTTFDRSIFHVTNVSGTTMLFSRFNDVDLTGCVGLDAVTHKAPSSIGIETIKRSRGLIPESFLRGCGLSDLEIEFAKVYRGDLTPEAISDITYRIHELRGIGPIQWRPVFISYSHSDSSFVDQLERLLNEHSIRFWRDIHDLKAGRLETQIDRAIRLNPVVILVLSQNSVESDWVEYEASKARDLEKELKRDVLCPVALDDAWKSCRWPGPLRRQIENYNILDFSRDINRQFAKLKEGLGLFYGK